MHAQPALRTNAPQPAIILPPLPEPNAIDEAHHRIANNLQMLSAWVSIEGRGFSDPEARASFGMLQRRIGAIATIHRQLCGAGQAGHMDLGAYLCELGETLGTAAASDDGLRICVDAATVEVTPNDATALGMIVSELVSNAGKYAYQPGEHGLVEIVLRDLPGGGFRLEVADSGAGMTARRASSGTGMGSRLIASMAERLGAAYRWDDNAPGTRFILSTDEV